VDYDKIGQLLIRYSAFVWNWRECGGTVGQYVRRKPIRITVQLSHWIWNICNYL